MIQMISKEKLMRFNTTLIMKDIILNLVFINLLNIHTSDLVYLLS